MGGGGAGGRPMLRTALPARGAVSGLSGGRRVRDRGGPQPDEARTGDGGQGELAASGLVSGAGARRERGTGRGDRPGRARDIDGFKGVNDEYGHAAGDRVLEAVSGALASVLREDDSLARLGGDEFAVLLGEVSGRAQVAEVARRLIGAVEGLERVEDAPVRLGLSVGICMSTGEQGVERADPWRVIERADEAMYEAKERGGGYSFG
jgi:diguanylate cyclase (GGDEF)-like protein